MTRSLTLILFCSLLLTSCGPSSRADSAIQTVIAETQAAQLVATTALQPTETAAYPPTGTSTPSVATVSPTTTPFDLTPSGIQITVDNVTEVRALRLVADNLDGVRNVAWSPDGRMIAASSVTLSGLLLSGPGMRPVESVEIRIWDADTGEELHVLEGHTQDVVDLAWSPDSTLLASASFDFTARIWDVATGQEVLSLLNYSGSVMGVAWSPDGSKVATGSDSQRYIDTIQVWDLVTGKTIRTMKAADNDVWKVAWSPDGTMLASGSIAGTVQVWDTTSWRQLQIFDCCGWIFGMAWSPDGTMLAVGSNDSMVRVWDTTLWERKWSFDAPRYGKIGTGDVAWSPDSRSLAAAGGGLIRIWDVTTGTELGHSDMAAGVAWSPDGTLLAVLHWSVLWIWGVPASEAIINPTPRVDAIEPVGYGGPGISGSVVYTGEIEGVVIGNISAGGEFEYHFVTLTDAGVFEESEMGGFVIYGPDHGKFHTETQPGNAGKFYVNPGPGTYYLLVFKDADGNEAGPPREGDPIYRCGPIELREGESVFIQVTLTDEDRGEMQECKRMAP